ncbi:MAG: hypothetical protein KFB96_01425 [Thiocapsa sp.]|uniref:hypothetical protein n=1 Tax=Thiocapsa sp. TaxID=2024551 RepID=UPI001BD0EF04|nr:hypothetical protein [Thiocapsa sp.]QVL49219.1 MAG: hypothetical protein KFB96_01425 [Thiocapsa sp.]
MLALANTLEQAAKLEQDPEAAAREAGWILYQKGILSTPPGSLKELLDLATADDHLAEWLSGMTDYPLAETETPDPEPDLFDLAVMA